MSQILLVGCGKMGKALVDGWLSGAESCLHYNH